MRAEGAAQAQLLALTERQLGAVGQELPHIGTGMEAYLRGGKRLRAGLLVAIALHGPRLDEERVARFAAFVELIHAGGLCHDDVVDRSPTRRGLPSIGAIYGARAAAIGGLYVMARAYELLAGESRDVRGLVAVAAHRVARGQAREMTDLYAEDVDESAYLERIADKTAALFELAAMLGGEAGGFPRDAVDTLREYGGHVGLAFQLADDVRDVVGGEALGRERGTDLREGVFTLPVLHALRHDGDGLLVASLRRLRLERSQELADRCCDLVGARGGVAAAQGLLRAHLMAAEALARDRCELRSSLAMFTSRLLDVLGNGAR